MSDYEEIIPASRTEKIGAISTGLPQLDRAIGGSAFGIPKKRMTLLTGPFSTGKTSLAFNILAQHQKAGMECLWVDTEGTFDKDHATMCGVDIGSLLLAKQSEYAEKVLDTIENFVIHSKNKLVVLDSYGGLSIRDEMEKDASGADFGAKAKMFTRWLRKIKVYLDMNNCSLIVMGYEYVRMGAPGKILAGGDGMAKTPSLWIDLYKKPGVYIKQGDERVGEVIVAVIKKTKLGGKKWAECEIQFVFGEGWNPVSDMLQDAIDRGVITRTGNTFFFGEEKLGTKGKVQEWMKIEENAKRVEEALV